MRRCPSAQTEPGFTPPGNGRTRFFLRRTLRWHPRRRRVLYAVVGALALGYALKVGFGRPRPELVPHESIVHIESYVDSGTCTNLWKLQGEVDRWIIQSPTPAPFALTLVDQRTPVEPRPSSTPSRGWPGAAGCRPALPGQPRRRSPTPPGRKSSGSRPATPPRRHRPPAPMRPWRAAAMARLSKACNEQTTWTGFNLTGFRA